jgi:hypothetical protein
MTRRYTKLKYWCLEFTDSETGLITEAGNEQTFSAIVVWAQDHLNELPKGEGKIVQKTLRKH